MTKPPDGRIEIMLSRLLTTATATAGIVTLAGLTWSIASGPTLPRPPYNAFQQRPPTDAWPTLRDSLLAMDARALMLLGVILLILTPAARVAVTLFAFARRRDGLYVAFSAFVLAILTYGMLGGVV